MSAYCHSRRDPAGETTDSWIRPHVCRWPTDHAGHPHECTCGFAWDAEPIPTPNQPTATMNQTTNRKAPAMTAKKITVGARVHYAPANLEAESAGLTPTWNVVATNDTYTLLVQLNAPGLSEVSAAPTADIVIAEDDDETNNLPAEASA